MRWSRASAQARRRHRPTTAEISSRSPEKKECQKSLRGDPCDTVCLSTAVVSGRLRDKGGLYTGTAWRSGLWLILTKIRYLAWPIRRQSLLGRSSFCASGARSQQPHLALREGNLDAIGLKRLPDADVQGRFQVSLTFFGVVDPDRKLEIDAVFGEAKNVDQRRSGSCA